MHHEIYQLSWIGSLLLAICGIPQVVKAARDPRSTAGLSWGLLVCWYFGELCMIGGVQHCVSLPVIANYACNAIMVMYLMKVKLYNE